MPVTDTHRTVDAVFKLESAKIIATLTRMVRDVALAEELAQDALVAALEQWPASGVPDNPGAWLLAIAKRRAVDHIRRSRRLERKQEQLAHDLAHDRDRQPGPDSEHDHHQDDVLRLMFISCHPLLPTRERLALTLRLLGGLTAGEIARAFLTDEQTIAQRIAAAKRTLADARVPFELPPGAELAERLVSVLEVIYLIFNEGYAATSGDDLMRPGLTLEAVAWAGSSPNSPRRKPRCTAWSPSWRSSSPVPPRAPGPRGSRSPCMSSTGAAGTSSSSAAASPRCCAPGRSVPHPARTCSRRRSP